MLDINSFKDYSNVYSASFARLDQSIAHAKSNRLVLDNVSNWYLFENEVAMGMPFLQKYKNSIINLTMPLRINKNYYRKPEMVSFLLYGTTDLWYLLLFINKMTNVDEFTQDVIRVLDPSKISDYQSIVDGEYNSFYKKENPKQIFKHYLKHPDFPSDELLPDKIDDELKDNGMKDYELSTDLTKYGFDTEATTFYYHGKSRMENIQQDGVNFINKQKRYMDSIHLNNNTKGSIMALGDIGNEFKWSGYLWFGKDGKYDFQFCGINGVTYMEIDGQYVLSPTNYSDMNLPEVIRDYDYFEYKFLNSDFKKRNLKGWDVSKRGRLVTDPVLKKPVYRTEFKDFDCLGEIICNTMYGNDINKNNEPLNNGQDGEILFDSEFYTKDLVNIKLNPFIRCYYSDFDYDEEIGYEDNWKDVVSLETYMPTKVIITKRPAPAELKKIEFGYRALPVNSFDPVGGEFRITDTSIFLIDYRTGTIEIEGVNPRGKWLPYITSYHHTAISEEMMFSVKWKKPGEDNYKYIDREDLAFVPTIVETELGESTLVTVKNEYTEKALLISNPNEPILIERASGSRVSYKGVLRVTSVDALLKMELSKNYDVEVYFDGDLIHSGYGKEFILSINTSRRELYRRIIETRDIKEIPFKIILRNVPAGYISFNMYEFDIDLDDWIDVEDDRFLINADIQLLDTIQSTSDDGTNMEILDMFKNGFLEYKDLLKDKPNSDKFILEFDATINSIDNGQFHILLEENKATDKRYSMVFNYEAHEKDGETEYTTRIEIDKQRTIENIYYTSILAQDRHGRFYLGNYNGEVYKYNTDNQVIWQWKSPAHIIDGFKLANGVTALYIDIADYIYIATEDCYIRKFTSDGFLLWEYKHDDAWINCIALDSSGNVLFANSKMDVIKLDVNGEFVQAIEENVYINEIFSEEGLIYLVGYNPNPSISEDGSFVMPHASIICIDEGTLITNWRNDSYEGFLIKSKLYNHYMYSLNDMGQLYITDVDGVNLDHGITESFTTVEKMPQGHIVASTTNNEVVIYTTEFKEILRFNVSDYEILEMLYDPNRDVFGYINGGNIFEVFHLEAITEGTGEIVNKNPAFTLENGLYKSYPSLTDQILVDIDPGIDFYQGKYSTKIPLSSHSTAHDPDWAFDKLILKPGFTYKFKIRKKRNLIILHINDVQICSWLDEEGGSLAYTEFDNGHNGMVFFNLDTIKIDNFKIYN